MHDTAFETTSSGKIVKPVNNRLGNLMRQKGLTGPDFGAGVICRLSDAFSRKRPVPTQNAIEHMLVALGGTTVTQENRIQVSLLLQIGMCSSGHAFMRFLAGQLGGQDEQGYCG